MDDYISRRAALKGLEDLNIASFYEDNEDSKEVYTEVKAMLKALPSAQPGWIPVSEKLPEENGQYLITVKYKHVDGYDDIYAEHGEWYDGKWDMFCFGHCGEVEGITAWMPLPKPYIGRDGDGHEAD